MSELHLTVELLRGLYTHSRLHAATTRSRRCFYGHDAVTTARSRRGCDAVTTLLRSRRGHDVVATRALLWPQRDHARQPRRGHDGCDAVTTRTRRCRHLGHDAFCGHDAVTTGHDRVTTRSRRGQVKPRARKTSCEHGFADFIHE